MKRTSKSFRFVVALVLVISLSFPMSFNAYALTDGDGVESSTSSTEQTTNPEGSTNPENTSPGTAGITNPAITSGGAVETTEPAITSKGGVETTPDAVEATEPEIAPHEQTASVPSGNTVIKMPKADSASISRLAAVETSGMQIDSVMVVNGGEEQAKNRDYVYKGEGKYYFTERRNASMTDARVFFTSATYTFEDFGVTSWDDLDEKQITLSYGGKPWDEWCTYDDETGKFDGDSVFAWEIFLECPQDGIVIVSSAVLFDAFYPQFEDYTVNIPYKGYTAVKKEGYRVFNSDPSMLGPHDLTLVYGEKNIDDVEIPLNLYDSFHTWDQIDDYARDLKQASDEGGNVINDKYVAVKSLAQSQAGRDIWNVVIAKDAESVDDYLTITKPKMESDPEALAAEIDNPEALDSGYHKSVLYFNNVHPDEVPASDAIMELIDTFINGGSLSYDTQDDSIHHDRTPGDYDGYTIQGEDNVTVPVNLTVDEVLDQYILVFNITENPDGKDNLVRRNEYGFDLNRDAAYQTQKESTALTSDLVKWDPMAMLEYHGYVDGLLIEPCTGPHDPNYEYDLYAKKMLDQGNAIGKAMIGDTAYSQYLVPATDYSDGWDDGAPIYGPMFAMLYGVMGYTLEIPYATEDSMEACYSGGLALINDCLDNRSDYYENKLNYKLRGINNEDSPNVDEYLIDPYTGDKVGRPRVEGFSFFPEYYVIPVDNANQRNPLEAYKTLQFLNRNGANLSVTTDKIVYDNVTYPAGTYVIDMHQANRGFVNSMLSDGYDASNFAAIYAELVISYPDMRNFDCDTIWDKDIFDGNTNAVSNIEIPVTQIAGTSTQVVIQNDNIDVIKLINKLLDNKKSVQMLTKDFGIYNSGDFVVNRADLEAYKSGLLVYGTPLEGTPDYIETITEPKIYVLGSEGHSKYILDLLGFNNYVYLDDASEIVNSKEAVILDFDTGADVTSLVSGGGIGYIGIGTFAMEYVMNSELLPGFGSFIPDYEDPYSYEPYYEGLVNADYSDDNLVTANYDQTGAAYIMNGTYITDIPSNGEALITVSGDEDFFKAGWYPDHNVLQNNMLAVYGYSGSDQDVPVTLFANNIFSKAHAQHTFNMFANAVYLTASDIELDNSKPFINATPDSQESLISSLNVTLDFEADRESVTNKADAENELTSAKYKVSTSGTEYPYAGEEDWIDYTSTTSITLSTKGTFYIHAYAENALGLATQKVFGPYNIGKSGGGGSGGGGSSTPATTTQPVITTPAITFTDISGHWARTSIEFVVGKKLFNGMSDTLFGPENTMTKGMLVTVLGRAKGIDAAAYTKGTVFTDVDQSAYYAPYVAWAFESKIISGSGNGLFEPDKPVTRGEMAVIITNYMKYLGKGTTSTATLNYADAAEIDSWGLEGVQFVTANGLMTGTSGNNFDFDGLSTRAQVATVLERLMKLIEQ